MIKLITTETAEAIRTDLIDANPRIKVSTIIAGAPAKTNRVILLLNKAVEAAIPAKHGIRTNKIAIIPKRLSSASSKSLVKVVDLSVA